jgi:hypothetical protein
MARKNGWSGLVLIGLSLLTCSTARAALLIKVDKSAQVVTVTRDGQTLHTWPVSTGRPGYATPSGNFTTFRMEAEHFSREWDDAPMPHSVFFTKQGHAIHGSFDTKRLGSPASHGCVRLAPANAAKLFALVKQEGLSNTQVVLTGNEQVALDRAKLQRLARGERRLSDRDNELTTGSSRQRPVSEEYAQPAYVNRFRGPSSPSNQSESYDSARDNYQSSPVPGYSLQNERGFFN